MSGLHDVPEALIGGLRRVFSPDIFLIHGSYELMVDGVALAARGGSREEIAAFLDMALDGEHCDGELRGLWRKAGAEAYIRSAAWCRLFLTDVRARLRDGKAMQ